MGEAPPVLSFHETIVSDDVDVRVFRDTEGVVHTGMVTGRPNGGRAAVDVRYSGADELAALHMPDGTEGLSHSPFYDPTWSGMQSWLRYGLQGAPVRSAAPAPEATDAASTQALVSVKAFTVAFYRLEDNGDAVCPDGSPGRAIHMKAYRDLDAHPLSDVIINTQSGRFCTMRFHLYVPGAVSFTGFVELHLRDVDRFCLATDGSVEGDVNDIVAAQTRHARIEFTRSAFAFPSPVASGGVEQTSASTAAPAR